MHPHLHPHPHHTYRHNYIHYITLHYITSHHITLHTYRHTHTQRERETDRQTDRQTDSQTGRQADRQTGRQTDSQTGRQAGRQTDRHTYVSLSWTSFVCILQIWASMCFLFIILRFFCLQNLARDDYCIGGFSLPGSNRYCNPTTALLIMIIILMFVLILILSILRILIIILHHHHHHHPHHPHPHHPPYPHHPLRPHHRPHQLIPVTITFVIISFLHCSGQQPHQHQKSGIVCDFQPFVTCSNSKKPRETVAAFRLHLAVPPLRLPPYPSLASFPPPWPQVYV